jgi:SagB-type dehydrogenase family enzyme
VTASAFERRLLAEDGDAVWELFHENSKTSRHERHLTYPVYPADTVIAAAMRRFRRVHRYPDFAKVRLPADLPPAARGLDEVLLTRRSARAFGSQPVSLPELAKVLRMSYGVSRDETGSGIDRPLRLAPSAGALYPLELFVYAARVDGLAAGLYHFDAENGDLDTLALAPHAELPAGLVVQADLAESAAATLFVAAVFFRSTFKYGDRGYRFVLLEAGHLVQNAILTAAALGLEAASIGGYFDRDVDRYLGMDGLNQSVVYMLHIGHPESGEILGNGQ